MNAWQCQDCGAFWEEDDLMGRPASLLGEWPAAYNCPECGGDAEETNEAAPAVLSRG